MESEEEIRAKAAAYSVGARFKAGPVFQSQGCTPITKSNFIRHFGKAEKRMCKVTGRNGVLGYYLPIDLFN